VKATPLGYPRDTGVRPQYKERWGGFLLLFLVFCFVFLEIEGPSNILIDRPVETSWVPRPEDWKGQVPFTWSCQTPLLSASQLGIRPNYQEQVSLSWLPSCHPWPGPKEVTGGIRSPDRRNEREKKTL
jgi:hypothetical protein